MRCTAEELKDPCLCSDIYAAMDQVKPLLIGGKAEDGVSYARLMNIIQKHFPEAKMGLNAKGNAEGEVSWNHEYDLGNE